MAATDLRGNEPIESDDDVVDDGIITNNSNGDGGDGEIVTENKSNTTNTTNAQEISMDEDGVPTTSTAYGTTTVPVTTATKVKKKMIHQQYHY